MIKVKDGYAKLIGTTYSGSADRVLLSNGGDKAVSDFAAASALSNYVTLTTAQTITGAKTFNSEITVKGSSAYPLIVDSTHTYENGIKIQMNGTSKAWIGYTSGTGAYLYTYTGYHKIGINDSGVGFIDSNTILHSGNYTDYTVKKDGTGATGTWPINITGNSATSDKLTSITVFDFGANAATYCKVASINVTGRYGGKSGLLKFYTSRTTSVGASFADSFEVFVHVYQQNPLGEKPVLQLKSTNTGDVCDVIGILNYSSSGSTFDIYAYGKQRVYCGLVVSKVYGNITIAPGTYISELPSGTKVTPLPMGNSKTLNGYLDTDFWKKTELTKVSQLTNDAGYVTGGNISSQIVAGAAYLYKSSSTPSSGGHRMQFYSGYASNVEEGSGTDFNTWYYPKDSTSVNTEGANIMNIRLAWDNSYYWKDIFMSPNSKHLWHRSVYVGTAEEWRLIYDSSNLTKSVITDLIGTTTYAPYNASGYLPLVGGVMVGALDLTNSPNSSDDYKMGLNTAGHNGGGIHFKKNGNNDWGQAITWSYGDNNSQAGIYVKSSGSYGTVMYLCTTNLFDEGSKAALAINHHGKIIALRNNFVGNLTGNASTTGDDTITVIPQYNNEINFGGTNTSSILYFGYRAAGSKPIPTSFVFGGGTGSASITASAFIKSGGTSSQFLKADGSVDSNTYVTGGPYLPLSGGTITSSSNVPFRLKTSAKYSAIRFISENHQRTLGIKGNGDLFVTEDNGWSYEHKIWHSGNLTKVSQLTNDSGFVTGGPYLPLSGGTLSAEGSDILVINRLNSTSPTTITYRKDNGLLGRMGFNTDGVPVAQVGGTYQTLIHSGNVGEYALKYAGVILPAESELPALNSFGLWHTVGPYIRFGTTEAYNITIRSYSNKLQALMNASEDGDWKTIAFTDSDITGNAATSTRARYLETYTPSSDIWWGNSYRLYAIWETATALRLMVEGNYAVGVDTAIKLADDTAFMVWGQPFFQNGKPKSIGMDTAVQTPYVSFRNSSNDGQAGYVGRGNPSGNEIILYSNTFLRFYTNGAERIRINSSGNVTIGASDLAASNYKLYVDGVGVAFGTTDDCRIDFQRAGVNKFRAVNAGGYFSWRVNGVDKDVMTINPNGNVTIGESDLAGTDYKLFVHGDTKFISAANNYKLYTRISQSGIQVGRTTANYTGGYNGGLTYGENDTALGYIAGVFNDKAANSTHFFYGGPAGSAALYIKNGNVGIGTSSPAYKLDVAGTGRFTGAVTMSSSLSVKNEIYIQNASYSTSGEGSFLIRYYNGNLQFSTRTTDGALKSYPLSINYDTNKATFNGDVQINGNLIVTGVADIPSVGNGTVTITQAGTTIGSFTMNQSDNTTIALTDNNYYPTSFSWTGGTTAGPTGSLTGSGMNAVSFGAIPSASASASGVVTTGAQTFAGAKTFSGAMTVNNTITFGQNDSYGIRTTTNNYCKIGESGKAFYQAYVTSIYTNSLTPIGTGGSIGTSSSRYSYGYFNNAVYAAGGFYESSDERLKNILKPVKVNLDDLSKLRKVYYLWRDRSEDGIQLGMIAQDVQRLYPELVSVDKETGYLSLAYDKLSVIALEAIDALYNDYKKLKERVDKLEKFLIDKGIS